MSRSILQDKDRDKTCLLCKLLDDNYDEVYVREEHHVMNGPDKKKAEHYGLKAYLCIPHHRTGKDAVHRNIESKRLLQRLAQTEFEKLYGHDKWMAEFGRNYLDL